MRSVRFRFPELGAFEQLMASAPVSGDLELDAPPGESYVEGDWVLAVFELGPLQRATSVAARVAAGLPVPRVVLEPRDRKRLVEFARLEANRPITPTPPAIAPDAERGAPQTERSPSTPPNTSVSQIPPRASQPSVAGARILVVDDDDAIRDMVAAMLEAVGLIVTTAANGEAALELFADATFDLVVLDWNMPRMTGLELCRTLRQKAGYAALPVLFLTANTSSSDMVEAFAAGADDYVVKPFRAPELGARIFSLLRRTRLVSAAG
ncbi:MAG: response regulator [Polyangiaceae bacterium]|nr:response regulator [Polyangiaceae bacterium]